MNIMSFSLVCFLKGGVIESQKARILILTVSLTSNVTLAFLCQSFLIFNPEVIIVSTS